MSCLKWVPWAFIADRTRRGRLARLRAGRLLPWIHTPYGYRCDPQYPRDPARLRIEATEAQIVRQMFHWYVDEGLSIHAIASRLMQRRIPTYRGGTHWHPAPVGGMLRNEVYAGTAYGNRDDAVEPVRWRGGRSAAERQCHHTRRRPQEEWIAVEVPPIIARELFERVQTLPHSTQFCGKALTPFVIPLQLGRLTPILGHQPHQPSDLRVTHAKHSPPNLYKPDHHRGFPE